MCYSNKELYIQGGNALGRIVEGYWDCSFCGAKGVRGGLANCDKCGSPRSEDTVFYMKDKINYVSEEKLKNISKNPDWCCSCCNRLNSDKEDNCISCGASKRDSQYNYFELNKKQQEKVKEVNEKSQEYKHKNISNYLFVILGVILIAFIISGFTKLLQPKIDTIKVTEMSWERSIDIEKYQTVYENGWNVPPGARLDYNQIEFSHNKQVISYYETRSRQVQKSRISHYESYISGHRDLGNGYFEEIKSSRPVYDTYYETEYYQSPVYKDEPVYRTKYYYEIDKWLYERKVMTSSKDNKPYWGESKISKDERESSKHEAYYINAVNSDGKTDKYTISYDYWDTLKVGESIKVKIYLDNHIELVEDHMKREKL